MKLKRRTEGKMPKGIVLKERRNDCDECGMDLLSPPDGPVPVMTGPIA